MCLLNYSKVGTREEEEDHPNGLFGRGFLKLNNILVTVYYYDYLFIVHFPI